MKTELEIGDKLQRFEVGLSREIDYIYEIESLTKTLAKTKCGKTFKKELIYDRTLPVNSKNKIIAEVDLKGKLSFSSPRFYLIQEIK